MNDSFSTDKNFALQMDQKDPLSHYREHFFIPDGTLYMDGNSLGLLSKESEYSLKRVFNEWRELAIKGWLKGKQPWFYFAEKMGEKAAELVGALPEELVLTGTTTINIHSLVSTLYQPSGRKTKILADELNFPSDIYALKSQIRLKGLDPGKKLMLVSSRNGYTIEEQDIVEQMTDEVALLLLPSVLYRSGQLLDMEYLTAEAHRRNIVVGFDCSHSVGAVPHEFDKWGVDFAVFCSYKYLNGGPGSPAFLYLNERHFGKKPMLAGWFGNNKETQFDMSLEFDPSPNAGGFQISSPGILSSAPVEGSLELINEAGIQNIRKKSATMTSYLVYLIKELLYDNPYGFQIVTPLDAGRRGGHIAITRDEEAFRINEALKTKGVVPDFRPPDLIRIAPSPLYNSYLEIWQVVRYLKQIIDRREYERFSDDREAIS
ncbi:MAG: kynureninase [Bacteroidales bacterium]|nr:kynureninase [Bacteroidales bacterium]